MPEDADPVIVTWAPMVVNLARAAVTAVSFPYVLVAPV
jgi:hypothetical protein